MITKDYSFLLNRPEHEFNQTAITQKLFGKQVMVTGAGGSIGSALAMRIAGCSNSLVLVGHGEGSIFDTQERIKDIFEGLPQPQVHSCIADVRSQQVEDYLDQLKTWGDGVVFHAAAHKHVGLMEPNPLAAFDNNTQQTIWLARQCQKRGIKFVFVSTDKAVNPTSVMGASKRIAEAWLETNFPEATICRFGNVLGSSGSLIPIIERRLAAGLPIRVTITDNDERAVSRYFITVKEAVGLVMTAGLLFQPGKYCLEMGEQIPIYKLVQKLCPEGTEFKKIPLRHGEKVREDLLGWHSGGRTSRAYKTDVPHIFGIKEYEVYNALVSAVLEILEDHANANKLLPHLIVDLANKL